MTALIAIAVAAAGGLGAAARFALDGFIRSRVRTAIPWGTMIVNVSGSLLLGVLTGFILYHAAPDELRLILGTGFLAGYTTFSTASFETVRLIQERRTVAAIVNGLGMLVLTVLAAAAGIGVAALF